MDIKFCNVVVEILIENYEKVCLNKIHEVCTIVVGLSYGSVDKLKIMRLVLADIHDEAFTVGIAERAPAFEPFSICTSNEIAAESY